MDGYDEHLHGPRPPSMGTVSRGSSVDNVIYGDVTPSRRYSSGWNAYAQVPLSEEKVARAMEESRNRSVGAENSDEDDEDDDDVEIVSWPYLQISGMWRRMLTG